MRRTEAYSAMQGAAALAGPWPQEEACWDVGACIGEVGPRGRVLVRGEDGWQIISDVAPVAEEPVIEKPGKGAFYATGTLVVFLFI